MKRVMFLVLALLAVSLANFGQMNWGTIIFANRNIPTLSGTGGGNGNGTYNVPIWGRSEIPVRPAGATQGDAYAISSGGIIVGDSKNSVGVWRATEWDSNNPTAVGNDLGALAFNNSLQSFAFGVNSRGVVVGKSQSSGDGIYHAFAMPQRQVLQISPQDNLRPNDQSTATSINGVGQIGGGSANGATSEHAWIWFRNFDNSITSKDLGVIPGYSTSRVMSINNRGQVVGWSMNSAGASTAFIWVPGWTAIKEVRALLSQGDALAWSQITVATGISDDGTVLGYGFKSGNSYQTAFFLRAK